MKLDAMGLWLMLAAALVGCGGDDNGSGANPGGGGAAGAGGSNAGGGTSGAGGGFVTCAAGKAYCNGACLSVGESAAGCRRLVGSPGGSLTLDDGLYYARQTAAATKLDLGTLTETELVGEVFASFGLALDATHVYFASLQTGDGQSMPRIDKVPKAGGAPEAVLADLMLEEGLDRLRFLGGRLYYRAEGTFGPGKLILVENAAGRVILAGTDILDYAVDATHIFYLASTGGLAAGSIGRAPLSDPDAVETVVSSAGSAEQLALLGDDLYWLSGSSLMRAPKAGGMGESVLVLDEQQSVVAHSDAGAVYLWSYGSDEDRLWRVQAGATQASLLARLQNAFFDDPAMTSSDSHVYVSRPSAIFEIAK
jgi:hypothetical protein